MSNYVNSIIDAAYEAEQELAQLTEDLSRVEWELSEMTQEESRLHTRTTN